MKGVIPMESTRDYFKYGTTRHQTKAPGALLTSEANAHEGQSKKEVPKTLPEEEIRSQTGSASSSYYRIWDNKMPKESPRLRMGDANTADEGQ